LQRPAAFFVFANLTYIDVTFRINGKDVGAKKRSVAGLALSSPQAANKLPSKVNILMPFSISET